MEDGGSGLGSDDEDEDEEVEVESYLLDQYKIRAKLDVLKDDVQAVIPITKVERSRFYTFDFTIYIRT